MLLDRLAERGVSVDSVGKIFDVFLGRGIGEIEKTKNNADGMAKTLEAHGGRSARPDLRQPGGFRSAVRPSQRRRGLRRARSKQFDAWLPATRRRAGATATWRFSPPITAATPPCRAPITRANTCPLLAVGPQVRAGVDLGLRAIALRHRPDGGREFRRAPSRTAPAFYSKFYEKTSHGGQLEDVQDARRNHRILREIPAVGRKIRALRDRDLSSFHESLPRPSTPLRAAPSASARRISPGPRKAPSPARFPVP